VIVEIIFISSSSFSSSIWRWWDVQWITTHFQQFEISWPMGVATNTTRLPTTSVCKFKDLFLFFGSLLKITIIQLNFGQTFEYTYMSQLLSKVGICRSKTVD
jgi:hypothetical protein